jgi:DNA-binding HxlR family transcriptional regulator
MADNCGVPGKRATDYIRASSISRALDVIGDRWVLMLLQQAFFGVRHFEEFQRRLGIARSTLTSRLNHLVRHEVLDAPTLPETIRRATTTASPTKAGACSPPA